MTGVLLACCDGIYLESGVSGVEGTGMLCLSETIASSTEGGGGRASTIFDVLLRGGHTSTAIGVLPRGG